MLSITVLSVLFIVFLFLSRKLQRVRWPKVLAVLSFNLLAVEIFVFVYLLFVVNSGEAFFLIGNQRVLDQVIEMQIVKSFYENPVRDNAFYQIDTNIGYSVGKNIKFGKYQSNAQGIRADREYSQVPDKNTLRVAAFGDSFVFCDGEANKNTWESFLEAELGNLEVLNFGVSGYGFGQSYLRYIHDGMAFHPDIIFFNYSMLGLRDVIENEPLKGSLRLKTSTVCRPIFGFKDNRAYTKIFNPMNFFDPAFRQAYVYQHLKLNKLEQVLNSPFFSMCNTALAFKNLYLQKKYAPLLVPVKMPDVQYSVRIVGDLLATAERQHSTVLFAASEKFTDLPDEIKKLMILHRHHVTYVYMPPLLDNYATVANLQGTNLFNVTQHYNAIGNHMYAEVVASLLKTKVWRGQRGIFQYDPGTNSFKNVSP